MKHLNSLDDSVFIQLPFASPELLNRPNTVASNNNPGISKPQKKQRKNFTREQRALLLRRYLENVDENLNYLYFTNKQTKAICDEGNFTKKQVNQTMINHRRRIDIDKERKRFGITTFVTGPQVQENKQQTERMSIVPSSSSVAGPSLQTKGTAVTKNISGPSPNKTKDPWPALSRTKTGPSQKIKQPAAPKAADLALPKNETGPSERTEQSVVLESKPRQSTKRKSTGSPNRAAGLSSQQTTQVPTAQEYSADSLAQYDIKIPPIPSDKNDPLYELITYETNNPIDPKWLRNYLKEREKEFHAVEYKDSHFTEYKDSIGSHCAEYHSTENTDSRDSHHTECIDSGAESQAIKDDIIKVTLGTETSHEAENSSLEVESSDTVTCDGIENSKYILLILKPVMKLKTRVILRRATWKYPIRLM